MKKIHWVLLLFSAIFPVTAWEIGVFPADFQGGRYSLTPSLPGVLELRISGDVKKAGALKLEVETPAFVTLRGVSRKLPTNGSYRVEPFEKLKENNYLVPIPQAMHGGIRIKGQAWYNNLWLALSAAGTPAGEKGLLRLKLLDGDKLLAAKELKLQTVEPIPEKRRAVGRFRGTFSDPSWYFFPAISKDYTAFAHSLFKKPEMRYHTWAYWMAASNTPFKEGGFTPHLWISFTAENNLPYFHYRSQLKDPRFAKLEPFLVRDAAGKLLPAIKGAIPVEISYVGADPEGIIWDQWMVEHIRAVAKDTVPHEIIINYEPNPMLRPSAVSAHQRKLFAQKIGLNRIPEAAELEGKFRKQYMDFSIDQHNEVLKKFVAAVKKHFPASRAVICTAPLYREDQPIRDANAVDPVKAQHFAEGFNNMFYHSGKEFYEELELNSKLKRPQLALIDPAERDQEWFRRYTPARVAQNIFSAASFGYTGIGIYPDLILDGSYYPILGRAFSALALAEDFYADGKKTAEFQCRPVSVREFSVNDGGLSQKIQLPEFSGDLRFALHQLGDEFLLTAWNFNTRHRVVIEAKVPGASDKVSELYTLKRYSDAVPGKGFLFELPPDGVRVFRIGKPVPEVSGELLQREVAAIRDAELVKLGDMKIDRQFAGISDNAGYGLLPESGALTVRLRNGGTELAIDPQTGNVVGISRGKMDALRNFKTRGEMGVIGFQDKRQSSPLRMCLTGARKAAGAVELEFTGKVGGFDYLVTMDNPLEGLEIRRVIRLKDDGMLDIETEFTNRSPRKMEMTPVWRMKNLVYPGHRTAKYFYPSRLTGIVSGGVRINSETNALLTPGAKAPFAVKSAVWRGNDIEVAAENPDGGEKLVFTPHGSFPGVYFWHSDVVKTLEFLSRPEALKFGNSKTYLYSVKLVSN